MENVAFVTPLERIVPRPSGIPDNSMTVERRGYALSI